jgi:uncharacterized membrane protein YbhN (UPF0104 family)
MLPGQATKRRWLRPALSLGLTAGLIAWLLWRVDRVQLWELLAGMEPGWFVLAAALVPLQVVLSAVRWRRFSVDLGLELTWPVAVKEYALSMFLNQVLPGGMAGDGVRVWRQRQGAGSVGPALRAAVVERATGQAAHLMLTGVGLLLWTSVHSVPRPSGSLELVGILLLGLGVGAARPAACARTPGQRCAYGALRPRSDGVSWAYLGAAAWDLLAGLLCLRHRARSGPGLGRLDCRALGDAGDGGALLCWGLGAA